MQPVHLLLAVLALLALTACDDGRGSPIQRETTVEITAVGGPLEPSGLLHSLTIELEVYNADGERLRFDQDLLASLELGESLITLPPGTTSARVRLPSDEAYLVTLRGFDADGNQLTTGQHRIQVGTTPVSVVVQLRSILGSGRLVPRLPITRLVPGQVIDLLHSVSPHERDDLRVPEHELSVTYAGNIEVMTFSARGTRVKVGNREDGDGIVTATAEGPTLIGDDVLPGVVISTFMRPFATGVTADVTPPTVTAVAYDVTSRLLTGSAYDDQSLQRLDIYDGPHLLATTDPMDSHTKDTPIVAFPDGATTFVTRLELPPGEYELTVLATDLAGNQTALHHEIEVP